MINRFLTQKPRRTIVGNCIDTSTKITTLRKIARHACREWGVRPCDVRIYKAEQASKRTREFGAYYHSPRVIMLNAQFHGDNIGVMLHELAHHIVWCREGHDVTDHGETFCAVYRQLLDRYNVLPWYAFDVIADHWGVMVSPSYVPAKLLR
jgi:hypothetical protein